MEHGEIPLGRALEIGRGRRAHLGRVAVEVLVAHALRLEPGYFLALLGTAPDNVVKAEAALRDQLERIRREPVPDEDLRVAKAYLLGSLAMDRRTNARQAWYLAALETQGVGHEYLERYTAQVRAMTAAELQRAAQRYLAVLRTVVVEPPPKP